MGKNVGKGKVEANNKKVELSVEVNEPKCKGNTPICSNKNESESNRKGKE